MSTADNIHALPEKKLPKKDKAEKKTAKNTLLSAVQYLQERYEFRYNVILTELEYKAITDTDWKFYDDRAHHRLLQELVIDAGINPTDNRFNNVLFGRLSQDYDPIHEYFNSLAPWDGADYISDFIDQVALYDEDKREWFRVAFKKWFVAMVASLINDRIVNHTCLIFVGPQNNFKTTFLNNIVPEHLQLDYLYSAKFQPADKDHEMYLGTKMLINLDELSTFNRTDVESLKSIITQDKVIVRKAFGKANTRLWRKASFCGSINKDQFLTDFTGSRRFLVFQITTIDYDKKMSIDNCYRQALPLYKTGFQYWFDREHVAEIEENNQTFYDQSMEEELIMRHYSIPTDDDYASIDRIKYYQTTDLAMQLAQLYNKINVNDTYKKRLGQALKRLGFRRISKRLNGTASYVWELVESTESYTQDFNVI